eukprot:Tbor_TRINITY_DN4688_c0_g1::TRINITY_DN4688_c0_g1_i1::g.14806::m.14806
MKMATKPLPLEAIFGNCSKALDKAHRYQQEAVGVDMGLKSVVYTIRLISAINPGNDHIVSLCKELINAITECRMMSNQWKYIGVLRKMYRSFGTRGSLLAEILTVIALGSRFFEQFVGDFGYIQKQWMHHWSLSRISWYYKMFKTFSLFACACIEVMKLQSLRVKYVRSVQSPVTASPIESSTCTINDEENSGEKIRSKMLRCCLLLARNIADMIIYFQWIECYNPNLLLQALCGMFSGISGIYLVWGSIDSHPK